MRPQHFPRNRSLAVVFLTLFGLLVVAGTPVRAAEFTFSHEPPWWGGGFTGAVSVLNDADAQLSDWSVTMTTGFAITAMWNAQYSLRSASDGRYVYVVTPADWNSVIQPNSEANFGFNGKADEAAGESIAVFEFAMDGSGGASDTPQSSEPPGIPDIAWISGTQWTGSYTPAWDLWWGENGEYWELVENGQVVHSAGIASASPNPQHGEVALTGRAPGDYVYRVRLCKTVSGEAVCSQSSSVSIVVADSGDDPADDPADDPVEDPGDDPSAPVAVGAPDKPVIAWMAEVSESGDYTVAWNLWWGENGQYWELYENGQQVHSASTTANTPQPQAGQAALTGRTSGAYEYVVRLCRNTASGAACSESEPRTVTVGDSGGTSSPGDDPDPGTGTGQMPVGYQDDRDLDSYSFTGDLAFQIHLLQGETRTWTFDQDITAVAMRRPDTAEVSFDGNALTVIGRTPGRTGLRITAADGKDYFMGLRTDHADGQLPGLPEYLAVGSVSEDIPGDLAFWQDMGSGLMNRRMDIRYIYLCGGPHTGWTSWDPARVRSFARESLRFGMIPFFVFYNIPDGAESYWVDLQHVQDANYMRAYYENMEHFLSEITAIMKGELYGVVLEPDFLGYMQQQSGREPHEISTADGTLVDTVNRINSMVGEQGDNVVFGWQLNLWARGDLGSNRGIVRRTDDVDPEQLGWEGGREVVRMSGEDATRYAMDAGVLSHGADFLAVDKYGLDAGASNPSEPWNSIWFWNADHWSNYLLFVRAMHETSGMPVMLWQIPVGHVNTSLAQDAEYGQTFPVLPNTMTRYEDSAGTYFLGDTFEPGSGRFDYFAENRAQDAGVLANGSAVTWNSHMRAAAEAGASMILFGAGVSASTDGVGSPPTDSGWWIQKVQKYYQSGVIPLN